MEYFDRHAGGEKALLVHLTVRGDFEQQNDLQEFRLLADSAQAQVLGEITGTLTKPNAKLFVGSGKGEEIATQVEALGVEVVLFNHNLSPSQERNLEALLQCRVVDRTGLILDIFARRARTYEGKLQVELAQLSHLSTRLVRGWTHLERQKGGIGLRGPGETQLETDRRLLQIRVGQLTDKLAKVKKTRQIGRAKRQKSQTPTVSLVGYTNAGKSTLFNRLTGDSIYAADQLFATLDPTLRHVHWQGIGKVVLADTVGFVQNLPHALVESFHATLEETLEADLLLHVIDSASPSAPEEIAAVNEVLAQLKVDAPVLLVYNKIDKTAETPKLYYTDEQTPQRVYVSAQTGAGMEQLVEAVRTLLVGSLSHFCLTLEATMGALLSDLYDLALIQDTQTLDDGRVRLEVLMGKDNLRQLLGQHSIEVQAVLPDKEAKWLLQTV